MLYKSLASLVLVILFAFVPPAQAIGPYPLPSGTPIPMPTKPVIDQVIALPSQGYAGGNALFYIHVNNYFSDNFQASFDGNLLSCVRGSSNHVGVLTLKCVIPATASLSNHNLVVQAVNPNLTSQIDGSMTTNYSIIGSINDVSGTRDSDGNYISLSPNVGYPGQQVTFQVILSKPGIGGSVSYSPSHLVCTTSIGTSQSIVLPCNLPTNLPLGQQNLPITIMHVYSSTSWFQETVYLPFTVLPQ